MKILHIPSYVFPSIGGIEQTARDILNSIPKEHEQSVFCFNTGRKTVKDTLDGIPVTRCGSQLKISSQSLSLCYGRELKRTFREFKPDLVIFHYPNPFASHYLLKRLKRASQTRLIVWWHLDITKQKFLGRFFRGQTKRLLRRAETIVATSPNYADGSPWLADFRKKCIIIPSCIDRERFRKTAEMVEYIAKIREKYRGKFICFALGRHVLYKGLNYLIDAAKQLKGEYVFLIGGKGELTDSLKKQAEGDDRIVFLGALSQSDATAYLYACDIFCFPSVTKNEAFGLALAEAMYCGKPAITFHIEGSGVNYVSIGGETGIEVENGNAEQYAAAIERLAKDDDLRKKYGEAAKKRVEENFTETIFRKNIQSLLDDISGNAETNV